MATSAFGKFTHSTAPVSDAEAALASMNQPSSPTPSTIPSTPPIKRSRMYEDIEEMMFGFGDKSWPPESEAVELMETLVTTYIKDLGIRAKLVADMTKRFDKECFLFLVRKDTKKFRRVSELLSANEVVKKVQKNKLPEESEI